MKIAFIADATPIKEDSIGYGMLRVNTRLITALDQQIALIISSNYGHRYSINDVPDGLRSRFLWLEVIPAALARVLHKIFSRFDQRDCSFFLKWREFVSLLRKRSIDVIFCSCGADPTTLGRAAALSRRSGVPYCVYLVDDFLESAVLAGNKYWLDTCNNRVPQWIKNCSRVFVISTGLKLRIDALYGVSSIVLPLPYHAIVPPRDKSRQKNQIIFVGNLSHFYLDGLRDLVSVVDKVRRNGDALTIKFTLGTRGQIVKLIGNYDFINVETFPTDASLRQEIAASLACFAPYSFDERYRVMVETSFPSKLLDYLSAASNIIVYGPSYSTAAQYFQENKLETVITKRDLGILENVVREMTNSSRDHGESFKNVLSSNHNLKKIRELAIGSISNEGG